MEVKNTADLKKIITLCRKSGIKSLKLGELEITLDAEHTLPQRLTKKQRLEATTDPKTSTAYTDEQLLMWSVQGLEEEVVGA